MNSTKSKIVDKLQGFSVFRGWTTAIVVAGPLVTIAGVAWSHIRNVAIRPEAYVEAPPTISRAIADPVIGEPFAVMMIIAAIFISASITLIGLRLGQLVCRSSQSRGWLFTILCLFMICEFVSVLGMIVLSQYRGDAWSNIHNLGSYMLFFGHGLGIILAGILIHLLLREKMVLNLVGLPRSAMWVGGFSLVYAVIYFTGHHLPENFFYWQRLLQCILEIFLITIFLRYLTLFLPFLHSSSEETF